MPPRDESFERLATDLGYPLFKGRSTADYNPGVTLPEPPIDNLMRLTPQQAQTLGPPSTPLPQLPVYPAGADPSNPSSMISFPERQRMGRNLVNAARDAPRDWEEGARTYIDQLRSPERQDSYGLLGVRMPDRLHAGVEQIRNALLAGGLLPEALGGVGAPQESMLARETGLLGRTPTDVPTPQSFSNPNAGGLPRDPLAPTVQPSAEYPFAYPPHLDNPITGEAAHSPPQRWLTAAVRDPATGQIYRGANHAEAIYNAPDEVIPRLESEWMQGSDHSGFVTQGGDYLTRPEAEQFMQSRVSPSATPSPLWHGGPTPEGDLRPSGESGGALGAGIYTSRERDIASMFGDHLTPIHNQGPFVPASDFFADLDKRAEPLGLDRRAALQQLGPQLRQEYQARGFRGIEDQEYAGGSGEVALWSDPHSEVNASPNPAQNASKAKPQRTAFAQQNWSRVVSEAQKLARANGGKMPTFYADTLAERTGYTPATIKQILQQTRRGRVGAELQQVAPVARSGRNPINLNHMREQMAAGKGPTDILQSLNEVRRDAGLPPTTIGTVKATMSQIRNGARITASPLTPADIPQRAGMTLPREALPGLPSSRMPEIGQGGLWRQSPFGEPPPPHNPLWNFRDLMGDGGESAPVSMEPPTWQNAFTAPLGQTADGRALRTRAVDFARPNVNQRIYGAQHTPLWRDASIYGTQSDELRGRAIPFLAGGAGIAGLTGTALAMGRLYDEYSDPEARRAREQLAFMQALQAQDAHDVQGLLTPEPVGQGNNARKRRGN